MLKYIISIVSITLTISCARKTCYQIRDSFPEFSPIEWLQAPTQSILKLRGKVILIRWWTDDCVYCINSAEALNKWYEQYHNRGLEILGMYHPKPIERQPNMEEIRTYIQEKGFQFPIGLDIRWENLNKYWLKCEPRSFTSVSFILDKNGNIVYIHDGGEFHKETQKDHEQCVIDYQKIDSILQSNLETLIPTDNSN